MEDMKRVACLYRVSSKMQLDDDDIPMQRNACFNFIKTKPFWKFEEEYVEKGVSGFHKSAEQRDVLQELKSDVLKQKFDVLLVFMFDRLGRREDETPFVVEWLVENGIEVWSVNEGQQTIDNRTDKLINYIRFWQSGGESRKTSLRVKEALKQKAENGDYYGGIVPFGYYLETTDKINKHGRNIKQLCINEEESKIVKQIFKLSAKGLGVRKIRKKLVENNIIDASEEKWSYSGLEHMLKNPIYIGYLPYGKTRRREEDWVYSKERLTHLIIIDDDTWELSNSKKKERTEKAKNYNSLFIAENFLFKEFLRCASCGKLLNSYTGTKRKDGSVPYRYFCRPNYTGCDNDQKYYDVKKYDELILSLICQYLATLKEKVFQERLNNTKKIKCSEIDKKIKCLQKLLREADKEKNKINDEIIKSIIGNSKYSSDQLSKLLINKENEISKLQHNLSVLENEKSAISSKLLEIENMREIALIWDTEFEMADFATKRELLSKVIDVVYLSKNHIDIHFKVNIDF